MTVTEDWKNGNLGDCIPGFPNHGHGLASYEWNRIQFLVQEVQEPWWTLFGDQLRSDIVAVTHIHGNTCEKEEFLQISRPVVAFVQAGWRFLTSRYPSTAFPSMYLEM